MAQPLVKARTLTVLGAFAWLVLTSALPSCARLVVLLSHNGFDVDHKLARRLRGIDVILGGHTHDALPQVVEVGDLAGGVGLPWQVSVAARSRRRAAWRACLSL